MGRGERAQRPALHVLPSRKTAGSSHGMSTDPTPDPAAFPVLLVSGDAIARYGFGDGHPFGTDRHGAFMAELKTSGLDLQVTHAAPRAATREELGSFHTSAFIEMVFERCGRGHGYLDSGDTPAWQGLFEAASNVVGATLVAVEAIMHGEVKRAFIPIAGLHHAARNTASGFCVFNDCGVAIEMLRRRFGLKRIAYVDIDAHHGDGVYYSFESDPELWFADIHEDGDHLFPGTGKASETGLQDAKGTKLNCPLPPLSGDAEFHRAWIAVEEHVRAAAPEFIILQCGADSIGGDPLTHLQFTPEAHGYAARRLCALADELGHGRVVATGGGGYNRQNLARAWTNVVRSLVESSG